MWLLSDDNLKEISESLMRIGMRQLQKKIHLKFREPWFRWIPPELIPEQKWNLAD